MIHYDLQCDKGHLFDGWFASSEAFDRQAERGQVECAICGSANIEKQLMAPGIPARANKKSDDVTLHSGPDDSYMARMLQMMRDYRKYVEVHSEDVGPKFAEEARKIHYRESKQRGIRGQATQGEAIALLEEGIEIHPLPPLPEEGN